MLSFCYLAMFFFFSFLFWLYSSHMSSFQVMAAPGISGSFIRSLN